MSTYARRGRPPIDAVAMFWERTDRAADCWRYLGACEKRSGRGKVSWRGSVTSAALVAWEIVHGAKPPRPIRNTCGHSWCCNPDHWRLAGKPERVAIPYVERWWPRFRARTIEVVNVSRLGACWEWQGSRDPKGYGRVSYMGRSQYAHIAAYVTAIGPIPDGLELDHLCRVTCCCNPAHLEAVTHRENCARSPIHPFFNAEVRASALAARRPATHCRRGHELAGTNLKVNSNGKRRCRACQRLNYLAALARQGRIAS